MPIPMSQAARDATCKALVGKTIKSMEWCSDDGFGGYWVITFTDDSEISFNRLMAEVV